MNNYFSKKTVFYIALFLVFLLLAAKLFHLQVYESKRYLRYSEKNRIRRYILQPNRGLIYDRHGNILVDNRPAYTLSVIPFESLQNDSCLKVLGAILDTTAQALKAKLVDADNPFLPLRLERDLEYASLVQIEERRLELPGVMYEIAPRRIYPGTIRAPHILGYIGEITRKSVAARRKQGLLPGDLVGKTGIEKVYDDLLRGKKGYDFVEIDAFGREVRDIEIEEERPPQRGADIYLSLDTRLQRLAETLFANLSGGAALIDVKSGEVLALCSKPDYDPNTFSKIVTHEAWQTIVNNEEKPLYDRMIKSVYPPGSTFKVVLAAAGLERGTIAPSRKVYCPGFFRLGRRVFNCWNPQGHGSVDLLSALKQSCNVYFYDASLKTDVDAWANTARRLGFGKKTGIDLVGENSGLVPDRAYLDKTFGKKKWTQGMLLNLGIGQGETLTTPIQIAQLAMIIANKGTYYRLHLLHKVYDSANDRTIYTNPMVKTVSGISKRTFELIQQGMYKAVNEPQGTAVASRLSSVSVAGKTGTAQNPHGKAHAWFIGFAPYRSPRIAVCVFVENGGSGGAVAAPLARKLLEEYFRLESKDKK